jgi:hypothetical protein
VDEHRIRLRGGWVCQSTSSATEPPNRITLPIRWDPDNPRRLRLSRQFGRPQIDPERQSLLLELSEASGIHSLLLNGKALTAFDPAKSYYLIPLAEIDERNTLVLEVETGESHAGAAEDNPDWGEIAILIRSINRAFLP